MYKEERTRNKIKRILLVHKTKILTLASELATNLQDHNTKANIELRSVTVGSILNLEIL